MSIKTIFLDRDGIINKDIGYLYEVVKFEFMKAIFQACLHYDNLGFRIIIISNQSGIARGFFSEDDYQILTKWMVAEFKNKGNL